MVILISEPVMCVDFAGRLVVDTNWFWEFRRETVVVVPLTPVVA